ncbi:MAG: hypothetical protein ACXAEI_09220 [Candidatus Hodarchaeales archaeon]|jgi:hypothetical protein
MHVKLSLLIIFLAVGLSISTMTLGVNNSADLAINSDPTFAEYEIGIVITNSGQKHAEVYQIELNLSVPSMIENVPFVIIAGKSYRLVIHGNFSAVQNWEATLWAICPTYHWTIWVASSNETQITKNEHGLTTEIDSGSSSGTGQTQDQEETADDQTIDGFSVMIVALACIVSIHRRR